MYRFKCLLAVSLCFSFSLRSVACICMDFRSLEENIKRYPFIAWVRILEKKEYNDTIKDGSMIKVSYSHRAKLKIAILQLFKGNAVQEITEEGVHTSCEIGVYAGEEWAIFASYDSATRSYSIGGCDPEQRIRNRKGERNWEWDGMSMITSLQKAFDLPVTEEQYLNGSYKNYYTNGQVEWIAEFKDHKLNGSRKVWYSDGKVCLDENYQEGKRQGYSRHYNNAGQLVEEGLYENGRCILCKEWNDYTLDPDGGHFIKTPEYRGKPGSVWLRRESYSIGPDLKLDCDYFKTGILEREAIYNYVDSFALVTNYYKSGTINYRSIYYWKEKKRLYQQWDENGKLEMNRVYINDKLVESKPFQ